MNESLKNLLLNEDDLLPLKKWTSSVNIFNIICNANTEIRHSKMLAWLLNVNENHGFSDVFVRRFIMSVIKANEGRDNCPEVEDWIFLNYDNQVVETEKDNIDIRIRFESEGQKAIVVIENKTGSKEHEAGKSGKSQTEYYREITEKQYQDYKKMFVFLTPDEDVPVDEKWCVLNYRNILEDIQAVSLQLDASPYVEMILHNYCDMLRQDVILEDPKLIEICEKIYYKHADAMKILADWRKNSKSVGDDDFDCERIYSRYQKELDLIFDNVTSKRALVAKKLREFKWNGAILDKNVAGIRFYFPELDEKIPLLEEKNSSWGTAHTYYFWFETTQFDNGKIKFVFELGLKNRSKEIEEIHNCLINSMSPRTRTKEVYKRLRSEMIEFEKEMSSADIAEHVLKQAEKLAEQWYKEINNALVFSEKE